MGGALACELEKCLLQVNGCACEPDVLQAAFFYSPLHGIYDFVAFNKLLFLLLLSSLLQHADLPGRRSTVARFTLTAHTLGHLYCKTILAHTTNI